MIVGAGPAGLAAAIRLKQISPDISVVVVEKGSEVGAHIMSGAVIDPAGLDALLPEWRGEDTPIKTAVTDDRFYMLGPRRRGAASQFPAAAADEQSRQFHRLAGQCVPLARHQGGAGRGRDLSGIRRRRGALRCRRRGRRRRHRRHGARQGRRAQGLLHPRHGIARQIHVVRRRRARPADQDPDRPLRPRSRPRSRKNSVSASRSCGRLRRTGTGPAWCSTRSAGRSATAPAAAPSSITTTPIWSRSASSSISTTGIPFCRRSRNSSASRPIRWCATPSRAASGIGYGARAIVEGGWQSVPDLAFPGGALIGDGAGFLNVPRIKGTHNAMRSGMLAAEHAAAALAAGRSNDTLADYEAGWRASAIGRDLWKVRNAKPLWSKLGTVAGIGLGGLDMWANTFGISPLGTLGHGKPDAACLKPAARCRPIAYPKPDGKLTFDRLSSVFLSNTNHEEDQPVHLKVADPDLQRRSELEIFAGPSARYCPAGVYEWVSEAAGARYVINAQNCVHCKTCDIKDPNGNITWIAPQGGGGPNYQNM